MFDILPSSFKSLSILGLDNPGTVVSKSELTLVTKISATLAAL
mgnify:CR=1 FL=1